MNDVTMNLLPDGRIALRGSWLDADLCKTIPGLTWDADAVLGKDAGAWCGKFAWATCVAARGVFGDRLAVGDALADRSWQHVDRLKGPESVREEILVENAQLNDYVDQGIVLRSVSGHPLKEFQVLGTAWLTYIMELCIAGEMEGAALTDEMGLGKTVQMIAAMRMIEQAMKRPLRVLVIAPKSMKKPWCAEVNEWWPGTSTHEVSGSANHRRKIIENGYDWPDTWDTSSVTVVNWEAVRLHSRLAPYGSIALKDDEKKPKELNRPWDVVVIDEAHRLKDPKSKQTRGVWSVAHGAQMKFAMTGTPVANNLGDMWSIMHAVAPRETPGKSKFIDRYALTTFGAYGGIEIAGIQPGREAEFRKIFDHLMRRAPKLAVLPQLPPLITSRRGIEMEPKQATLYRHMEENAFARVEQGDHETTIIASNPGVQNTRLMQFASSYCIITTDGEPVTEDGYGPGGTVTPASPSNKVDALLEYIDDELGDRSLVVFAMHRKLIELAGAALDDRNAKVKGERGKVRFGYIVGGQTETERQDAINEFQAGRTRVILCTIAAGGVGITLTKASVCIFMQRSFSLVDNLQAEGRVHRIGSEVHDFVQVIDLYSPETVDEIALAVREGKAVILQEIVRDRERFLNACRMISEAEGRHTT